ncbi:hypothetical protein EDD18DRAFT_1110575 [Armillaria luteobubalina]|uniref:CxC2-like cysteine cluster KDZ transposase-associated domain-containing protein n=1 Tax=Armillaria luteobubalina TaxID=153913 RepID=A0AA39PQZ7_9AGAR|nr:hypothetical protein EDD18DRAFT_1110575 [Armillaria luteobubalina]
MCVEAVGGRLVFTVPLALMVQVFAKDVLFRPIAACHFTGLSSGIHLEKHVPAPIHLVARAVDNYVQMLCFQWFPASTEFPHTAMTFQALCHFQLLSFMSKASVYEYYHTLERLTDNTGVHCCPNLYQVFLWIVREWRHVRMLKRHG